MKVFSHGCVVNFQESTREMFSSDLDRLINNLIRQTDQMLFGTVDLDKQEVRLFGHVQAIRLDEESDRCEMSFTLLEETGAETVVHSIEDLLISHEALFDILDDVKGQVSYRVVYLTFADGEGGGEITYFFADANAVTHPLACVAEFWQQVSEVGRDVDFNLSGCTAHDLNRTWKKCDCE
ncbi:hypothetical protein [Lihuaxuella thermophila]|uniref:Uncharacterized protein n=1 Tax=Lihuaxuella thermophila TaxID=1173111 RepID=A0A1H8AQV6_9BACL|nr:hypothetical protein [Lihuaxuella thermophila]SEM72198.1 hypothetical protein SAMN05444955_101258 [Lihuaxuella thermophila]